MSVDRGTVVFATDPFKADAGRPFLVISTETTPFHGEQYITFALTTRTWHDDGIRVSAEEWVSGGAPKPSSIMPWSVNAVAAEWISHEQGRLREEIVRRAIDRLQSYLE
ncbi:MAG: type II toxin-antitoxin system PemK/MazF family toxin [Halobacteriota archaeon]